MDLDALWLRLPSPRTLVVSAGVLVLLLGLGAGAWFWHASTQRQAASAYAVALGSVQSTRAPQAPPETRAAATRALEAALQSYPSAPAAAEAAYELGALRYADKQYPQARSAYEIALARGASGTVRTLARFGIAYTWEAERNLPKASEAFQAALGTLKPTDALYEPALLDLARVQELAGRKDDAVASYRLALKELKRSGRLEEVRMRLATLGVAP